MKISLFRTCVLSLSVVALVMPDEASANIFGSAPSYQAGERVRACNEAVFDGRRAMAHIEDFVRLQGGPIELSSLERNALALEVNRLATSTPDANVVAMATALNTWASQSLTQLTTTSSTGATSTSYVQALLESAVAFDSNECDVVYSGVGTGLDIFATLVSDLESSALPPVYGGLERSVGLLIGGGASAEAGASEGSGASDFSPALGVSYSSNSTSLMLLIDPSGLGSEDRVTLSGAGATSTFGSQVLSPVLSARSMYATVAQFPVRRPHMVMGWFGRIVARTIEFDIQPSDDGVDASDDGAGTLQATLMAPSIGGVVLSDGLNLGDSPFTIGFQAAITARAMVADVEALSDRQRETIYGRSTSDGDGGFVVAGVDATLFMSFKDIAPYTRFTVLTGPSYAPRSLTGFEMTMGLDVLAALKFEQQD